MSHGHHGPIYSISGPFGFLMVYSMPSTEMATGLIYGGGGNSPGNSSFSNCSSSSFDGNS